MYSKCDSEGCFLCGPGVLVKFTVCIFCILDVLLTGVWSRCELQEVEYMHHTCIFSCGSHGYVTGVILTDIVVLDVILRDVFFFFSRCDSDRFVIWFFRM